MRNIVLTGGRVLTPLEERFTNVWLKDGLICALADRSPCGFLEFERLDVSNCIVTPGLIDLQVNGGPQCDLWANPSQSELTSLSVSLARAGVTAFLPTLITADLRHIKENIGFLSANGAGYSLNQAHKENQALPSRARMLGIHLEGPFLSPERLGVHPHEWIKKPAIDHVKELLDDSVRLITMAPEEDFALDSIRFLLEKGVTVSLGHSNATFDQAKRAFDAGVSLVTHTYNALPPLHHRAPGAVIAAMLDKRVSCSVICDGKHVSPHCVELLLKTKGIEKVVLVTDVAKIGTRAGALIGSSIFLNEAVKNVVLWNIGSFIEAIRMSTWNAASVIGVENSIGHIAPGKCADLIVWDSQSLAVKHVIIQGVLIS